MEEIRAIFNGIAGFSKDAWPIVTICAVVIALIKVWPSLRQQSIDERLKIRDRYLDDIEKLRAEVKECREGCDKQEADLRKVIDDNKKICEDREKDFKDEIDALRQRVNNEAWQRTQSEISLVTTLVQILPDPHLKTVLDALQKRNSAQPSAATAIGEVVGDARGSEK